MADENENTEETNETPDLGAFVPESFKTEDGKFDTAAFRASYDDLTSFKSQAEEREAALPKDADGYAFALPEDHQLPEGFDPETLATTDEKGNKIEFDPKSMIDESDPDVAALKAVLHEAKADPSVASKLASIMVNRELRSVMEAQKVAQEEKAALGPQAKERISTVQRELNARVPQNYADAISNSITSADALRGIEQLIKASPKPITPVDDKADYSEMSPRDRILAGLQQRQKRA